MKKAIAVCFGIIGAVAALIAVYDCGYKQGYEKAKGEYPAPTPPQLTYRWENKGSTTQAITGGKCDRLESEVRECNKAKVGNVFYVHRKQFSRDDPKAIELKVDSGSEAEIANGGKELHVKGARGCGGDGPVQVQVDKFECVEIVAP